MAVCLYSSYIPTLRLYLQIGRGASFPLYSTKELKFHFRASFVVPSFVTRELHLLFFELSSSEDGEVVK